MYNKFQNLIRRYSKSCPDNCQIEMMIFISKSLLNVVKLYDMWHSAISIKLVVSFWNASCHTSFFDLIFFFYSSFKPGFVRRFRQNFGREVTLKYLILVPKATVLSFLFYYYYYYPSYFIFLIFIILVYFYSIVFFIPFYFNSNFFLPFSFLF